MDCKYKIGDYFYYTRDDGDGKLIGKILSIQYHVRKLKDNTTIKAYKYYYNIVWCTIGWEVIKIFMFNSDMFNYSIIISEDDIEGYML